MCKNISLIIILLSCTVFLLHSNNPNKSGARIDTHDPVMIQQDSVYYAFMTGRGISVWSSKDMKTWNREKPVFDIPPQWAIDAVPGYRGHTWAPDISYHNGQYYIYYSVSSFGKNTSCIGLATNKTLHPNDPNFEWVDHGALICSVPGVDNWNAIDPNLIFDRDGTPYLFFGSFWDGLQMIRLTDDLKSCYPDEKPITIASRNNEDVDAPQANENYSKEAGSNAIEAPFVFKKDDYYYLFASIDYCCRGIESTYKMIYGRSDRISGPYYDKDGIDMRLGGGAIIMEGDEDWHGVGHNAVVALNGDDYLVFHAYDAKDGGRSKLRIFRLSWDQNHWPKLEESVY